jgi:hypothetical protein
MKKKTQVPIPKPNPIRFLDSQYPPQGTPMRQMDHPANTVPSATDHHEGTELGDAFTALGPKAASSVELGQMNTAVGVSEAVPRKGMEY